MVVPGLELWDESVEHLSASVSVRDWGVGGWPRPTAGQVHRRGVQAPQLLHQEEEQTSPLLKLGYPQTCGSNVDSVLSTIKMAELF